MQFTVPQFIERESKIWLNMTFTQFIYIGSGGVICLMLYFSLAKKNLLVFLMITGVIMALAGSLAFLRVGGRSLPTLLKNFFFFTLAPKMYLWHRKEVSPRMIKTVRQENQPEDSDKSSLKLSSSSQLRNLSNSIETKK
jgi:hypothetical protein